MSVNSLITDKGTKLSAQVVHKDDCDCDALIVTTVPLRTYDNSLQFFANDDYGANMNIDVVASGTPVKVYNADDALWTATDIVGGGKTTFASGDQDHTTGGGDSLKVDNAPVDDVYQLDKGSDLNCTLYSSITLWVYVDKDWKALDVVDFYGWDTGLGSQIGDAVDLSNYFNFLDYDIWQKLVIPLTDMGALSASTTLDALRVRQAAKEGKAPKYYLDDIQFEEVGTVTPVEFCVEPDKGTWLHIESMQIIMADAYSPVLENSTMPKIPYNALLGVAKLDSGITYRRIENGEVRNSSSIKQFLDMLSFSNSEVSGYGSDGTNTWVTIHITFNEPIILKAENEDRLCLIVNDDLSGLLELKVAVGTKIEVRE